MYNKLPGMFVCDRVKVVYSNNSFIRIGMYIPLY